MCAGVLSDHDLLTSTLDTTASRIDAVLQYIDMFCDLESYC